MCVNQHVSLQMSSLWLERRRAGEQMCLHCLEPSLPRPAARWLRQRLESTWCFLPFSPPWWSHCPLPSRTVPCCAWGTNLADLDMLAVRTCRSLCWVDLHNLPFNHLKQTAQEQQQLDRQDQVGFLEEENCVSNFFFKRSRNGVHKADLPETLKNFTRQIAA